ncbi:MAG: DHH family phosphoesterase, partial [Lachnospiraceae bacterium]|nr:DHH family phosphoesterase [Lachnospiraceae bacterium]
MEKWIVRTKRAEFDEIAKKFQIDPVTARIIRNRDVVGDDQIQKYLYGGWEDLYDPKQLHDGVEAAKLLSSLIQQKKRIRIIGDYDIDGVTSSYILRSGIERCNGIADHVIPHRIVDGYGVNEQLITQAHEDGIEAIVTCDNGISAFDAIQLAKEYGMTVIVTDHHEVPFVYKEDGSKEILRTKADFIVNPKQAECSYPFKGLCGASVAFKFIQLLYLECGIPMDETREFLSYVAIGTVGDVMDLIDENRILVKLGLEMIHQTQDVSLLALIKQCKLKPEEMNVYSIGFVVGPCMNASGRLDTAEITLELLLTKREPQAS